MTSVSLSVKVKEFELLVVLRLLGVGEREERSNLRARIEAEGKIMWVRGGEIKWNPKR